MNEKNKNVYNKSIIDPYEWLPGYGESNVAISGSGRDSILSVCIYYDSLSERKKEMYRKLDFEGCCDFRFHSVPGGVGLGVAPSARKTCETNDVDVKFERLTDLFEIVNSEPAHTWNKHFNFKFKLKHYSIYFSSENRALEVIANNVIISKELLSSREITS